MPTAIELETPLSHDVLKKLDAGDEVLLSGDVLVFRDQVHIKLMELLDSGQTLPFDVSGRALYYCGPTPARHGMPVGSAGPTTASRMDKFTPRLLGEGLLASIGKGDRDESVVAACAKFGAVYFVAVGGTGAYIAKHISASRVVAYPELGAEAARIFTFDAVPLYVGIDARGNTAFAAAH
jgi:fumarate hydratase subunit beta